MQRAARKPAQPATSTLIEKLDHLRSLASELRLAEDRERKRLATDLHDHLVQFLVLGRMKLGLLAGHLTTAESIDAMNDVRHYLDEALRCARTMMADLRPMLLGDADDLPAAIAWAVEQLQRKGLTVAVKDDGKPKILDEEMLTVAYQSVHELLTNVLKHAGAREATLRVRRSGDCVEICVKDRGKGLDSSLIHAPSKTGGFGLFGIRERIEKLGGRFEVVSNPQKGTSVELAIPLKKGACRPVPDRS